MTYTNGKKLTVETPYGTKKAWVLSTCDGVTTVVVEDFIMGMSTTVFLVKGNSSVTKLGWKVSAA